MLRSGAAGKMSGVPVSLVCTAKTSIVSQRPLNILDLEYPRVHTGGHSAPKPPLPPPLLYPHMFPKVLPRTSVVSADRRLSSYPCNYILPGAGDEPGNQGSLSSPSLASGMLRT